MIKAALKQLEKIKEIAMRQRVYTEAQVLADFSNCQAGYAQIEAAKRPRKATLQKAADALGITLEQLAS